ncbi:hypothetical protein MMC25_007958 [Agyrium rufum]|nr:hypothetical protein [Agyrium rufum]
MATSPLDDTIFLAERQSAADLEDRSLEPFSCLVCKHRKVKCDRKYPCKNCSKAGADCVFRAPAPPRRGQRKSKEPDLLAKVRRYERQLRELGVDPDEGNSDLRIGVVSACPRMPLGMEISSVEASLRSVKTSCNAEDDESSPTERGTLISRNGGPIYLENHLWATLSTEFNHSRDVLETDDDDTDSSIVAIPEPNPCGQDIIFSSSSPKVRLDHLRPDDGAFDVIWDLFRARVDPLAKILHLPTASSFLYRACAGIQEINSNAEALAFAVCYIAITSTVEGECETVFGESRITLLARYRFATQRALVNASFMKSTDIEILQALLLYLPSFYSSESLTVILTVWWQIGMLDSLTGAIAGSGASILGSLSDTQPPLNVNDVDIYPGMTEPPQEHTGVTESIFCRLRYEIGIFLKATKPTSGFDGAWQKLTNPQIESAVKERSIDELEQRLEEKIIRHCDPLNPLHMFTTIVARASICSMRLLVNHPGRQPGKGVNLSSSERKRMFLLSLKSIEYVNMVLSVETIRRYQWHARAHFQWHAFVFILSELCTRVDGDEVEHAWAQVDLIFDSNPEMLINRKSALHSAIMRLLLRAWEARKAKIFGTSRNAPYPESPRFLTTLIKNGSLQDNLQDEKQVDFREATNARISEHTASQMDYDHLNLDVSATPINQAPAEMVSQSWDVSSIDWATWDTLIQDAEIYMDTDIF